VALICSAACVHRLLDREAIVGDLHLAVAVRACRAVVLTGAERAILHVHQHVRRAVRGLIAHGEAALGAARQVHGVFVGWRLGDRFRGGFERLGVHE
jgi:hypothetical protein